MSRFSTIVALMILAIASPSLATTGLDISADICQEMALADWQCLVNSGYSFAIIQTFQGGYGMNPSIGTNYLQFATIRLCNFL
jgi:hypothetical protein